MCPRMPQGAFDAVDVTAGLPFVGSTHHYTCVGEGWNKAPEVRLESPAPDSLSGLLTDLPGAAVSHFTYGVQVGH